MKICMFDIWRLGGFNTGSGEFLPAGAATQNDAGKAEEAWAIWRMKEQKMPTTIFWGLDRGY